MRQRLKPILPIHTDETLMSWVTRLAGLHTGDMLVPFLNDYQIVLADLVQGKDSVVQQLSDITGMDPSRLRWQAPQQIGIRRYRLRNEEVAVEIFRGTRTGFCPACLLEDDERGDPSSHRRGRLLWIFDPVRTCRKHSIELIDRKQETWLDRTRQMNLIVPERGAALEQLIRQQTHRTPSDLQGYIEARLQGARGPEWLDNQELEQAVRATEMLGVVLEYPPEIALGSLTSADWDVAAQTGFQFTSRGETGIQEAFFEILENALRRSEKVYGYGPQFVFRQLYHWAEFKKNKKDPGPIKTLLRQFSVEHMRTDFGRNSKRAIPKVRGPKGIQDLSREHGVHYLTLRKILAAQGIIPEGSSVVRPGSFDVKAAEEAIRSWKDVIPRNRLPQYMDATRGQVSILIETGLLPTIDVGKSVEVKMVRGVAKSVVDRFLEDLHRNAVEVDEIPEGMKDIPGTAQKSRVTTDVIVEMVRQREVESIVQKRGQQGYLALHLDPVEVSRIHEYRRPETCLTRIELAEEIGMYRGALGRLLAAGWGPELFPGVSFSPGGPVHVTPDAIKHFVETYVTLNALSSGGKFNRGRIKRRLLDRGVAPMIDPALVKVTLYRRADIPPDLLD